MTLIAIGLTNSQNCLFLIWFRQLAMSPYIMYPFARLSGVINLEHEICPQLFFLAGLALPALPRVGPLGGHLSLKPLWRGRRGLFGVWGQGPRGRRPRRQQVQAEARRRRHHRVATFHGMVLREHIQVGRYLSPSGRATIAMIDRRKSLTCHFSRCYVDFFGIDRIRDIFQAPLSAKNDPVTWDSPNFPA